uniref:Exportin-1/Importin-beta-like domain-containing protein n=1 Tax=Corethron hystrix TaxID=216773 RepID=A0A7S1BEY2_9STRA
MSTAFSAAAKNLPPTLPNVVWALSAVFPPLKQPQLSSAAVSSHPFPGGRGAADKYLTHFQDMPEAWTVCDALLSSVTNTNTNNTNPSHLFFAAQTLHVKCREHACGIRQLPPDSLDSLRDGLIRHLRNLERHDGNGNVGGSNRALTTRLAMALSALAVQMSWETAPTDILRLAGLSAGEGGGISRATVLDLLSSLPEETDSRRLVLPDERTRDSYRGGLRAAAPQVLPYLDLCISERDTKSGNNDAVAVASLRCFSIWVRVVDMPSSLVATCLLLHRCFEALQDPDHSSSDFFEAAVDAVIGILRVYHHVNVDSNATDDALVRSMSSAVMALRPKFEAAMALAVQNTSAGGGFDGYCDQEDLLRGHCRIFTEMGESYMGLILNERDMGQMALVDLVLASSAIPDHEIASITLNFWYRFVHGLESLEPMSYRYARIDHYAPVVHRLLNICAKLLQYPEGEEDDISPDRMDDIRRDRYYVRDTVEDCCRVLGGNAVLNQVSISS